MNVQNPFLPIYKRCNTGTGLEKLADSPDFPIIVDLEFTNICNFSCKMCETGRKIYHRPKGYMSDDTYLRILNNIAPQDKECKTALRIIGTGEPTLHPKWKEFLKMAKDRGILLHLNTNGSRMDEENIRAILDIGIDSVKFSFQGATKEKYLEMRSTDFFDELLSRMKKIKKLRSANKPFLQISTTVLDETKEEIDTFKKLAEEAADYVNVGITHLDFTDPDSFGKERSPIIKKLKEEQTKYFKPPVCFEVFHKVSFDWDGTINACCFDNRQSMALGNIHDVTIEEIWKKGKHKRIQEILANNGLSQFEHCKSCVEYIPLARG